MVIGKWLNYYKNRGSVSYIMLKVPVGYYPDINSAVQWLSAGGELSVTGTPLIRMWYSAVLSPALAKTIDGGTCLCQGLLGGVRSKIFIPYSRLPAYCK